MYPKNRLMSAKEIMDTYFLENRARVLEIAAFLDRIDRAEGCDEAKTDFRYRAFCDSLKILTSAESERTKNILLNLSDLSTDPVDSATGLKTSGAWQRTVHEDH